MRNLGLSSVLLFFVFTSMADACGTHLNPDVAIWEGHVVDSTGHPVKGVSVTITQGSYTTQGKTDWMAFGLPKGGAILTWYDPNATVTHYINTHNARTNHSGRFEFRNIQPGTYMLFVANEKLSRKYVFPAGSQAFYEGGHKSLKTMILTPK
jgi:hypothetical protein